MEQTGLDLHCERCGTTFDSTDGHAVVNYDDIAGDLPLAEHDEFIFALCRRYEQDWNEWLDRGAPTTTHPSP